MINMLFSHLTFITYRFGELDLPMSTIYILISLTIFVFLGVVISSLKLIQSALENKEE